MLWNTNIFEPLDLFGIYSYASFYFAQEPLLLNRLPAQDIQVLKAIDGTPLDATEVVVEYLKTHIASPELQRIRLLQPMPPYRYRNPEVQPLWGATP